MTREYIVRRASACGGDPKVEGARVVQIHEFFDRKIGGYIYNGFRDRYRDWHPIGNGFERGIEIKPIDVWVCQIDDLCDFVKRYGSIVLDEPKNEEGYWQVLIYDSYIE